MVFVLTSLFFHSGALEMPMVVAVYQIGVSGDILDSLTVLDYVSRILQQPTDFVQDTFNMSSSQFQKSLAHIYSNFYNLTKAQMKHVSSVFYLKHIFVSDGQMSISYRDTLDEYMDGVKNIHFDLKLWDVLSMFSRNETNYIDASLVNITHEMEDLTSEQFGQIHNLSILMLNHISHVKLSNEFFRSINILNHTINELVRLIVEKYPFEFPDSFTNETIAFLLDRNGQAFDDISSRDIINLSHNLTGVLSRDIELFYRFTDSLLNYMQSYSILDLIRCYQLSKSEFLMMTFDEIFRYISGLDKNGTLISRVFERMSNESHATIQEVKILFGNSNTSLHQQCMLQESVANDLYDRYWLLRESVIIGLTKNSHIAILQIFGINQTMRDLVTKRIMGMYKGLDLIDYNLQMIVGLLQINQTLNDFNISETYSKSLLHLLAEKAVTVESAVVEFYKRRASNYTYLLPYIQGMSIRELANGLNLLTNKTVQIMLDQLIPVQIIDLSFSEIVKTLVEKVLEVKSVSKLPLIFAAYNAGIIGVNHIISVPFLDLAAATVSSSTMFMANSLEISDDIRSDLETSVLSVLFARFSNDSHRALHLTIEDVLSFIAEKPDNALLTQQILNGVLYLHDNLQISEFTVMWNKSEKAIRSETLLLLTSSVQHISTLELQTIHGLNSSGISTLDKVEIGMISERTLHIFRFTITELIAFILTPGRSFVTFFCKTYLLLHQSITVITRDRIKAFLKTISDCKEKTFRGFSRVLAFCLKWF